jgi:DNA polymerase-3 subunit gamma/tau
MKGFTEVQAAEKPVHAAEMLLVRLAFAADLPTPDEALRALRDQEGGSGSAPASGASKPSGSSARLAYAAESGRAGVSAQRAPETKAAALATAPRIARLEDVAALAAAKRDLKAKHAIEQFVRPVRIEEGRLEIAVAEGAPKNLVGDLSAKLSEWTGRRWLVVLSAEQGGPTLAQTTAAERDALKRDVRADPLVEAVLARFPGAEIVDVRKRELPAADPDADVPDAEPPLEPGDDGRRE